MSRCCRAVRRKSSSVCLWNSLKHHDVWPSVCGRTKHQESECMAVPFLKEIRIGAYLLKQKLSGRKRYPLVLMLEPLFRCNLACAGCGKIDYPAEILNQRLSVQDCLGAADECPAPVVVIAGGEPLLHKEIDQIVDGAIAR